MKRPSRVPRLCLEPLEPRVLLSAAEPALDVFHASPALFAANLGQWQDPAIRYVFQGAGGAVAHTDAGPVFLLSQHEQSPDGGEVIRSTSFSVTFGGAEAVQPTGQDRSGAVYNYYVGDPSAWRSDVPTFQTVAYLDLWAGVDLLTWGRRDGLKYEFHVAPGADPGQIQLHYDGVEGLRIDENGALHVTTALGEVVDDAPFIYQDVGGQRVQVAGAFLLLDAATYSFAITGAYDPRAELVIDPALAWSSYLGGDGDDVGTGIAVDGSGNVFVTGTTATLEPEFPTVGGFDTTLGGTSDAFITKVSGTGSLLWSSYLGGSGAEAGYGVAVDGSGNVFITGKTTSSNFPTVGGFDTSLGGTQDAFVTKVSGAGAFLWSSYLGGSGTDAGSGIAVDAASGNAFIAGYTESSNFPTSGGFDTTLGGTSDGFVTKVSGAGGLLWSSYLGGSGSDAGNGIAVDGSHDAFIAGSTTSSDFPTSGGFDTTLGGSKDAFVAKVSGTGSLAWSSYLGGSGSDDGYGIAVDGSGNAFLTGETASSDLSTPGGFQTTYGGGGGDGLVAKVSGAGSLLWASYLGGAGYEYGDGIAVDGSGNAFITGETSSSGFATPEGFQTVYGGGTNDAYVTKVSGTGSLLWSSYLGGSDDDVGWGIAADGPGNAFITGYTTSTDFPAPGGFDTEQGGYADAFVTKVNASPANHAPTLTAVSTLPGGVEDTDFTITYATLAGAADEADVDGDPLSFRIEAVSSGTLTKGGVAVVPGTTLLSAGESLVWHPAANANGTLSAFTVKAWDGQAASATAVPVSVAVAPVNDAPTLTTVSTLPGGVEDTDFTITYATLAGAADEADVDGDPLSFRIEAVSSGTLTKGGVAVVPGTTLLSAGESLVWHPAANANGTLSAFTVKAWDGQAASATAVPVSVAVAPVNDAPTLTAVSTLPGGVEDTDFTITYATLAGAADEADVDGDPLSFRIEAVSSGTLTKGGVAVVPGTTLLSAGESLVWHPAANANGTLPAFTVKAWDGLLASATAAPVQIQVAAVNDPPTANAQSVTTAEDTAKAVTLAGNDGDPEVAQVLTFAIVTGPSHGALSGFDPATGAVTYTPAGNYNGPDSFTFTVTDDASAGAPANLTSAAATVSITVTPVNDVPVANAQGVSTSEDTVLPITLAGTDGDPEVAQVLTFAIATGPSHGALSGFDPATGAVTYTPDGNYNGPDSFTFTVTDDALAGAPADLTSAPATVSITVTAVNDPPTANAQSVTTAEDTALPITLTGADGDPEVAQVLTFAIASGPSHGALSGFNSATGAVTYTPNGNYNGPDSFTFTVTDDASAGAPANLTSVPATASLTVTPVNDAPSFTKGPDQVVGEGDGTQTVAGWATGLSAGPADEAGQTLAFLVSNDNNALFSVQPTVSPDGTLSYIPSGAAGSALVTVTLTDSGGTAGGGQDTSPPQTFTITVVADSPPTLTSVTPLTGAVEDQDFTITYQALADAADEADVDGDPLSFRVEAVSSGTLTKGGVAVVPGTTLLSAGESLVWHPAANANGTLPAFTVEAWDGELASATAVPVSVQVTPVNDPPVADGQSVSTAEDTALPITLTGADGDPEVVQVLTFAIVTGPSHGTLSGFNASTGAVTYTPAGNYNGPDSFTFTVTDDALAGNPAGLTSAAGTVSITVTPVNDPPVADGQSVSTAEDTALPITLTGADGDPEVVQVLTFAIVTGPSHGTLSGFNASTGAVMYTPAGNYNGPDSFTFTVTDDALAGNPAGLTSAAGTVSITVTPVNDPPVADGQSVSTAEDTVLPITLTGADGDPEVAQVLTFAIVTGPSHGTLSGFNASTGAVTYTPAGNYNGPDSFTFTVTDDALAGNPAGLTSAAATVSITVTAVNDAPAFLPSFPADPTVLLAGQAFSFHFDATDVDADPLSYSLVSGPSWLSMGAATGILSGTPTRRADIASNAVTVRVSDGQGGSDAHTFQVTVQGQVITLGAALPVPLTKTTFTDASGDLVSVGVKGAGRVYLVRGVAPGAGGVYSNNTPGDLVAIEAEGTDAKSAITIGAKATVKGQVARTSVRDIVVTGSLGSFGGALVDLKGNLTVTRSVAKLTLGDVAGPHVLTMGADPLILSSSVVLGRVLDATLSSSTPLMLLSVAEWLDTDATPDRITAPWISSLTTRGSKVIGGPAGNFQASVTLSGVGATKGTLGKASIAGSVVGGTWSITGAAGSVAVRGGFTNCTFQAGLLKSFSVVGTISENASDGDTDVIRVASGGFTVRDFTGSWWIDLTHDHWFSGTRAYVG